MPDPTTNRLLRFRRKRKLLTTLREANHLEDVLPELPAPEESVRMISFCAFSAVGFIRYIADRTTIRWMGVVTFRVGRRVMQLLRDLHRDGRLQDADFVLGRLAGSRHGGERKLYDQLVALCAECGWHCCHASNHAKVILFDTPQGRYVLETSCNLNDAPNWEQFCLEQDPALYDFYFDLFFSGGVGEPLPEPEGTADEEETLCQGGDSPQIW